MQKRILPLGMLGVMMGLLAVNVPAHASTMTVKDWLMQSKVSGDIRNYYYTQDYGSPTVPNTYAYSLGGMLKVQTAPLYGLSAGIAFYTANDLGVNDHSGAPAYPHLDQLLMGTGHSLNVLGQAYLQYENRWATLRAGDQLLDTPWMWPADAFMIPNTFQAVYGALRPLAGVEIEGLRSFRYKNRTAPDYGRNNLLNIAPESLLYRQFPAEDNGALAFGVKLSAKPYGIPGLRGQAWFYKFYNLANFFWGAAHYGIPLGPVTPFADAQFGRQWGDGADYAGPIDATVYGIQGGLSSHYGEIFAAYNEVPSRSPFSVGGQRDLYNGGFISPYTQPYNADPLFTSIMNYGLVSASAPGFAWKVGFIFTPTPQWRVKYSYSWYHTTPYVQNVSANYLSVGYALSGTLKGLTLRDRLAIDHGFHNINNGSLGTLVDNRVMLQYAF